MISPTTTTTPTTSTSMLFQDLAQLRDELRLQAHLGKAEMRDELQALEPKWHELRMKLEKAEDATIETGEYVGAATRLLMDELRDGYERIRHAF
jgi:hypothetical protein